MGTSAGKAVDVRLHLGIGVSSITKGDITDESDVHAFSEQKNMPTVFF